MKLSWKIFMIVGLALVLLGPSIWAQEFGLSRAELAGAIAVQERHTDALMADPDVVGTGVGVGANGQPVIKVFVKSARNSGLQGTLDGIPVITQVTGEIIALKGAPGGGGPPGGGGNDEVDPTARFRPAPIGVSTGHPLITAGTSGARVTDGAYVYALSNNHVYANQNDATLEDPVLQPGTFDGGSIGDDVIGTLSAFVLLQFDGPDNMVDAAIAQVASGDLSIATPSDGYGTPKSETVDAKVGMRVMKYGRTTSQTKGRVDAINVTVNVNYGAPNGVARFVKQIFITPGGFSAGGDSGALIVTEVKKENGGNPVGLLFAGSVFGTIANPIDVVLEGLAVELGVPLLSIDGQ